MLQILVGFLQSWGHYFSSFLHCRAPSKATTNCGEQTQGCAGSGSVTIWRWCHEPLTWKRPSCWRKDAWPVNVTCLMHPWPSIHHASMENLNFPPDFKYIPSQMSWYFEFWLLLQWSASWVSKLLDVNCPCRLSILEAIRRAPTR